MPVFFLLAFLAGMLTILAPCVLPLLPVIVGRSMAGETSARRLLLISISLGASVFLFTMLLKASTAFISVPLGFWQVVSGALLIIFGLSTLAPGFWDRVPGVQVLYRSSNRAVGIGYRAQSAKGDILIGAALGPVFSSCSPTYFLILAAVLPAHFATGVLYLFSYSLGMSALLFVIALLGQKAAARLGFLTNTWVRRVVGIIFLVVGVAVIFGLDKKLEAVLPQSTFAEVGLEERLLGAQSGTQKTGADLATSTSDFLTQAEKLTKYPLAPELVSPDGFINTDGAATSLAEYRGKSVVLVDFWDYSCINCQRTLPYLNAWYEKYKDEGLVIIGVHTPEFAFEHLESNVEAAVKRFGIEYPVVLDNEYATWNAFRNEYWPREYLIDIDGFIVHDHAGEGEYAETEKAIQAALAERAARLGAGAVATSTVDIQSANLEDIRSPETYFGSARNEYLGNGVQAKVGTQTLVLPDPATINPNTLYLGGTWNFSPEYAEAGPGATVEYEYGSHDVYIVATNPQGPARIKVFLDGKPVGALAGADVDPKTGEAVISGDRLYKLVHDPDLAIHTITIEIESGTLDAYTFTFG